MYTNGLLQHRIAEAFELCQKNNTQQIRQGQQMLKQMRLEPTYILLLIHYLDDRMASEDNKMLAATQIYKVTREMLVMMDEELYVRAFVQLFCVYMRTTDRIAKYLRKVLEGCPLDSGLIQQFIFVSDESLKCQVRLLKLYKMYLKDAEDDCFLENSDMLIDELLKKVENEAEGRAPPMCMTILYEIIRILVIKAFFNFEVFQDKVNYERWMKVMKYILKMPPSESDKKLLLKTKLQALQCLTLLIQFKIDDYAFLIEHFNFVLSLTNQDRQIKDMILQEMAFFCRCQWDKSVDPAIISAINQKIAELAIAQVYNPQHMLKLLRSEFKNFIEVYFQNLNEGTLGYCRKIFKELSQKHYVTWRQYVDIGMNSEPTANVFLNFVCQSAIQCSDMGVRKHKFQKEQIRQISTRLQETTMRFLWEAVEGSNQKLPLNDQAICTIISALRFYSHYRYEIPKTDIFSTIRTCSKLALKNEQLRRVCYYFLKKTALLLQPPTSDIIRTQPNAQLQDILRTLLRDVSKLDALELQLGDLQFVSTLLFLFEPQTIIRLGIKQELKKICLMAMELASAGGDHEGLRHVMSIPCVYIRCYNYDKDFNEHLPNLMDKGACNPQMALLFINYFTLYKEDPKRVDQMYKDIVCQEFLSSNIDSLKFYLPVLQALIQNVKPQPTQLTRIQTILMNILKKAITTDNSKCVRELLQVLTVGLSVPLNIKELYSWLLARMEKGKQRNNSVFHCLTLLMAFEPPKSPGQINQSVEYMVKYIKKQRFSKHFNEYTRIMFDFYGHYFQHGNPNSNKFWGILLENLLKRLDTRTPEELQTLSKKFHQFEQKYKLEISELIKEKYQIVLTQLLLEHTAI